MAAQGIGGQQKTARTQTAPAPFKPRLPASVAGHLAAHREAYLKVNHRQNRGEKGAPFWEATEPLDMIRREIELGGDALSRAPADPQLSEALGHLAKALTALHTAFAAKVAKLEAEGKAA